VNKQYVFAILLSLAVFLIAACGSDPAPEATTVPTAVPDVTAPTNTPAPTATTAPDPVPAATNTPSATVAAPVAPAAPSPTAKPAATAVPAPAPTIDLAAARSSNQPPHIFVGTAKIDGIAAPHGTIVSVLIGDQTVEESKVYQDDGTFETIKVNVLGHPVTFKISDFAASQAAITTEKGGANVVNLEASSQ
jgi:hypothetical protein